MLNADGSLDKSGGATRQWFLNNDATEGGAAGGSGVFDDGGDVIFGDNGNDWLVGGTGRDTLWGGWGNDLLNVDDDLGTHGGLNDRADTDATYQDRAVGGAGRDVLIANTGGDRLIDWSNEVNTYLVPFWPSGEPTIVRLGSRAPRRLPLRALPRAGRRPGPRRRRARATASRSARSAWSASTTSSGSTSGTAAPTLDDVPARRPRHRPATSDLETLATTRQARGATRRPPCRRRCPRSRSATPAGGRGPQRRPHGHRDRAAHPGSDARVDRSRSAGPWSTGRRPPVRATSCSPAAPWSSPPA